MQNLTNIIGERTIASPKIGRPTPFSSTTPTDSVKHLLKATSEGLKAHLMTDTGKPSRKAILVEEALARVKG